MICVVQTLWSLNCYKTKICTAFVYLSLTYGIVTYSFLCRHPHARLSWLHLGTCTLSQICRYSSTTWDTMLDLPPSEIHSQILSCAWMSNMRCYQVYSRKECVIWLSIMFTFFPLENIKIDFFIFIKQIQHGTIR